MKRTIKSNPPRPARKPRPAHDSIVLDVNGDRWTFIFDANPRHRGFGFAIGATRQIIVGTDDVLSPDGCVGRENECLAYAIGEAIQASLGLRGTR